MALDFLDEPSQQTTTENTTTLSSKAPESTQVSDHTNTPETPETPAPIAATPKPPLKRRIGWAIAGVLLLVAIGGFVVTRPPAAVKPSKSSSRGGNKDQITPVLVATVMQKTVPVQITAIGNVQSGATVSVTPQVGGKITGVFFKKGEEVRKGQLLFTLDDRSQTTVVDQAQAVVAKDQAQIQQARATLAKDLGQVEQARATLVKDQGLVRQAEALLAKDTAQAQFSQAQSNRYDKLYKEGAISLDQAQQYKANNGVSTATLQSDREAIANAQAVLQGDAIAIENAKAVVEGDKAAIENAQAILSADFAALDNTKVQSSYTKIYAPIDGLAGNILVTEGNVVQANTTNPLVIIQKVRPIQVAFSIPEVNLAAVQQHMENGKLKVSVTFTGNITTPNTSASNTSAPNVNGSNANAPISGVLTFLNNTVDNSTGTIQLIGDFDNTNGRLFPGQFVNTTLTLTEDPNAMVVPAQAVQNGPNGQFVFVVKSDNTVENVPVVASNTTDGLDVIQKGVQPGMQVVIDGQANLVTGSKIRIQDPHKKPNDSSNPDGNSDDKAPDNKAPDNKAPDKQTSDNKTPAQSGKRHGGKSKNGSSQNSTGGTP